MKYYLATIYLLLVCLSAHAATISGTITDEKGQPLSFASVYVKNTSIGVSANLDGKYSLQLSPGNYDVVFQYVGYTKKTEHVVMSDKPIVLDVRLQPEAVAMKEVTVVANAEDPAYRVIRAAIKKKKYYLNQLNAYSCKVYIKGVDKLDSIPKHLLFFNTEKVGLDSTMLGIVYLSESESEYNFQQPNKVKEVMISSKVSGDNEAFSWNQASDFDFNFYKNLLDAGELSDRGFVSPISETAMLYYRYKLIGTFIDDGEVINKIQVIPKRKSDPVFSGYIYIVEDSWRIHSTDMFLTKDAGIDFVDSLELKQSYGKVNDSTWMPFNQTMFFRFKVLGIKGRGRYVGVFTNYNVSPNFPKRFFKGEVLKVNDDANKKDSAYWNVNRPIPLTREEINDYRKKDSLERIENSKQFKDSIDRKQNKLTILKLIGGYTYNHEYNKTAYSYGGLIDCINYNTVEGWAPQVNLSFTKNWEDNREFSISTDERYGISDKLFSGEGGIYYSSNPVKFTSWSLDGGKYVQQINPDNPISPIINTISTLVYGDNYMKLLDNTFIKGSYGTEIVNGLNFSAAASYNLRSPLYNSTYADFNSSHDSKFTSNYPYADSLHSNFAAYKSLLVSVGLVIHFKQKYYTRPHEKIILSSKYPAITLNYTKGIAALGSTVNFDKVEASVRQHIKLGLFGQSDYSLTGGDFLNRNSVGIAELQHFDGNQTILAPISRMNAYQLLPYYQYSTDNYYVEGHFEHHFEGFLLNKIPLIRKLKLHEVVGVHYLYTDKINYAELSAGLEHLLKYFRVDFVTSYSNTLKLKSGILIGFDLFNFR